MLCGMCKFCNYHFSCQFFFEVIVDMFANRFTILLKTIINPKKTCI